MLMKIKLTDLLYVMKTFLNLQLGCFKYTHIPVTASRIFFLFVE